MSQIEGYASAHYPPQYRVMGARLQPLSIGHATLLHWLGSPFATGEGQPGAGDLALAVALCRRDYAAARQAVRYPWFEWEIKWRAWRLTGGVLDIERLRFQIYWVQSWSGPKVWRKPGGRTLGSPLLQTLKLFRSVHMGASETEAMNGSLRLALWDYAAYWESQGSVQIRNSQEAQLLEAAKAERARLIEEEAKKGAL